MEPNLTELLQDIHTTHTFGAVRDNGNSQTYLYKEILFNDKSLLCSKEQEKRHTNKLRRTMAEVRKLRLDEYVFAYLGAHEFYYSLNEGKIVPPFGVFFSKQLDDLVDTKILKYDLASDYNISQDKSTFYKDATEARTDAVTRIENNFAGNFFSYWISNNYEFNFDVDENSWKWKLEFHYHQKVDLEYVEAILWPVIYVADFDPLAKSTIWKADSEYENFRQLFIQQNPNIKVYPFYFNVETAPEMFIHASYVVTKHYSEHFSYPSEFLFTTSYSKKFSVYE